MQKLVSVLKGNGKKAHINVVAFNTAFVLWTAGIEKDLGSCLKIALAEIDKGSPWEKFSQLKTYLDLD